MKAHDIEHFQKKAALLKEKLFRHLDRTREAMHNFFGRKPKFIIFISVSNMEERARVFCGVGNTAESAWLNALNPCKNFETKSRIRRLDESRSGERDRKACLRAIYRVFDENETQLLAARHRVRRQL
ncbi:hypothetical protein [Paenibacillus cisolokensis]|uniref:hypothetical protein n=1 Tax=Paenibacillus cisolokensis TaxID=1658519 RepID=UPI001BCCC26A|nr:hypothetical protein [Paenibacillus cisolokensis]